MWLSLHERKEARSRAPEYARDYLRRYGDLAEEELEAKLKRPDISRYYRTLYRLALRELRYVRD